MAQFTLIKSSFGGGELAPTLWGRTDLALFHSACSTLRNCFVDYRSGVASRGGTGFAGQCKAPGDGLPPRNIPFQATIDIAYCLEFGDKYMRVVYRGAYVTRTPIDITAITQASPCRVSAPGHGFSNGDWISISDVEGMEELNNVTFIVADVSGSTFTLRDTFGDVVDSRSFTAYSGGGKVAEIYEIASPYAIEDLPYLKFTQSAEEMSICCVNTATGTEYPPYDLVWKDSTDWQFKPTNFASRISPPTNVTVTTSNTASDNKTEYQFVVTSIDANTEEESVASQPGVVSNSENISSILATLTVTWNPVDGASSYNIYKAPPAYKTAVPIGSTFGYAGTSKGTQFVDTNILQDFTQTPPVHYDPFAPGQITDVVSQARGSGYEQSTTTVTVNSSTGSGARILPVVVNGGVAAYIIENAGGNYRSTDTVTVSGEGSGARATLTIGALTGTYPSVVEYVQQRRCYANSLNAPDTYHMSQPGKGFYTNFDASDPPIDSDAFTGTPWSKQVNGIQWIVAMPSATIMMTGGGLWRVSGSGGGPLSPSSQEADSQEYIGVSATVPPLRVKNSLLYVQSKGSIINDIQFNFVSDSYTGEDISFQSNHLFAGKRVTQWAWSQEPWKLVWGVRDDGRLLSLTYVKDQKLQGWGRHDTNGLFEGVTVISEPPVDAPYFIVKRFIPAKQRWAYYQERMNERLWNTAEDCWCVDSGVALKPLTPDAELSVEKAEGTGLSFKANKPVFDGVKAGVPGQIIRMGGGKASVTAYVSPTEIIADIVQSITNTLPNNKGKFPIPAPSGKWSIASPVTVVHGLNHLEGFEVTGLLDGAVMSPKTVVNGSITLDQPATVGVIGLPFVAQMQTMNADVPGAPTIQNKRQKTGQVTLRMVQSRGVKMGTDQPNASADPNQADIEWGQATQRIGKLVEYKDRLNRVNAASYLPLFTGDLIEAPDSDFDTTGMVAFQQDYPLPMGIAAVIANHNVGDKNSG